MSNEIDLLFQGAELEFSNGSIYTVLFGYPRSDLWTIEKCFEDATTRGINIRRILLRNCPLKRILEDAKLVG